MVLEASVGSDVTTMAMKLPQPSFTGSQYLLRVRKVLCLAVLTQLVSRVRFSLKTEINVIYTY